MRFTCVLLCSAAALVLSFRLSAQAVISAHSGVVHFSEGSVFLDDQPLDHKVATFPSIKEGSTLRTEKGRAEILLTPGVVLRLDENSAIRMRSTALSDTRVEFLHGAAIVDSVDALGDNHVILFYKDTQVRFPKPGVYRLDYETGTLQAYSGEAEVKHEGKSSTIDDSHLFFFTLDLDTKKLGDGTDDEFYDWARDRSNAITAENQLTAQNSGDVDDADSSDPNALGASPNFGLPNSGLPYPGIPNAGIGSYPSYGYNYPLDSALLSPFGAYGGGYLFPFPTFPIIVIARPYRAGNWPRNGGTWSRTNPGWGHSGAGLGYMPSASGIRVPMIHPSFVAPRPMPPVVRPAYSHIGVAPRPAAPAVHAIGHR